MYGNVPSDNWSIFLYLKNTKKHCDHNDFILLLLANPYINNQFKNTRILFPRNVTHCCTEPFNYLMVSGKEEGAGPWSVWKLLWCRKWKAQVRFIFLSFNKSPYLSWMKIPIAMRYGQKVTDWPMCESRFDQG